MSTIAAGTTSTTALVNTGDTTGKLTFQTNGTTTAMTIDTSQNVGIGTTTPGAKLSVSGTSTWAHINGGNSNTAPIFASLNNETVSSATFGWLWYNNSTNGNLDLYRRNSSTTDTQVLSFDRSNGNVGIGTDSPGTKLQVVASGSATKGGEIAIKNSATRAVGDYAQLSFQPNSDYTGSVIGAFIRGLDVTGSISNYCDLVFGTGGGGGPSERMRLDYAGNVLINTTDVDAGIGGNVTATQFSFRAASEGYRMSTTGASYYNVGNANATQYIYFRYAGTGVGSIQLTSTATSYTTGSDYRLKENIAPAGNAQDILNNIEIVQHDWKAGGHTRFGVVAQDLNEVYPEAVSVGDDGETVEQAWAVDYSKLVPLLVKSIQELKAEFDAYKAAHP